MKRILFIDDLKERYERFVAMFPNDEIVWVDDLDTACNVVLFYEHDEIWLDHDAGLYEKSMGGFHSVTYWPVVCVIAAKKFDGSVYIHSANGPAAERMRLLLLDQGVEAIRPDSGVLIRIWGGSDDGSGGYY